MPLNITTNSPLTHLAYRAEIDGLRAIAVLSVVVFHSFPNLLPGGFIGVDIFFVISGFLISTIIFENINHGHFDFFEFYRRRIRRIFPALIVVLISCLTLGWLVLLTDEYLQLAKHTMAGVGFISNFLLWRESGYFDNASETKPLLHLWSLGIEEQFYIFWPFFVWLAWRIKLNFFVLTVVLVILSFGLNVYSVEEEPISIFYSPLSRVWELLLGALIAYVSLQQSGPLASLRQVAIKFSDFICFTGVLLLGLGLILINKAVPFPGAMALLPTVGTACIILSGSTPWLNRRLFNNRVLVWFGLISFPLYLWHWPLLSFARIIESATPSRYIRIAAVLISIALAWLTYRLIETPVRTKRVVFLNASILSLILLCVGAAGYAIVLNGGLPNRSHATLDAYEGDLGPANFHKYINDHYFLCTEKNIAAGSLLWEGMVQCAQSKGTNLVDIALVGDSHAEHLFLGLAEALPSKNVAFYIRNSPPYLNNPEYVSIFKHVVSDPQIRQVILTMWWIGRTTKQTEEEILKVTQLLLDSGKEVFLTDDVPNFGFDPQKCKGKRWLSTTDPSCTISQETVFQQPYVAMLHGLIKKEPRLKLIETQKYLCDSKDCSMARGDKLLYRDFNHLNIYGSKYVGARLAEEIVKP